MSLEKFFNPHSVAVLGVSRNPEKIGSVIFKNIIDSGYKGKVFAVNPNEEFVMGYKAYSSVLAIKDKIDLAVISVPSELVIKVVEECGKKKIKNVIMVTAGFKEVGDIKLEERLLKTIQKNKIKLIGPNCLGVINNYNGLDTLFIPIYRLKRPDKGNISFVTQSGAFGSTVLDLISAENYRLSKFISYGNGLNVDESDVLNYLSKDKETGIVVMYVEGVKDGKKFFKALMDIKKPVLILKGGKFEKSSKSTLSHTGSLAGINEVYEGIFKQTNAVITESMQDIFDFLKLFEKNIKIKGGRIQIITNGGGHGVISSDAVIENGFKLAELSRTSKAILKKELPSIATVSNPLDVVGDADDSRYELAIETCLKDRGNDVLLVNILYQTPKLTKNLINIINKLNNKSSKPIVVVSTGANFTEELRRGLEDKDIPCFQFPGNAVRAMKAVYDYYKND